MKVLFVTAGVPYPPDTGGHLRSYNLLRCLSRMHDITLVCFEPASRVDREIIGSICRRLVTVPHVGHGGKLALFRDLVMSPIVSDPLIASRYASPELANAIRELATREHYDLVHCDSPSVAGSVTEALDRPGCMGTHNVEALVWLRYASVERNPLKRTFFASQYSKVRRFEKRHYARFERCLVVSEDDRRLMSDWYGIGSSAVVPNGVDVEYFHPNDTVVDPYNIVFLGSMDWRPNQDAVSLFCREIWPLVKVKVPDATFTIVGRCPPQSIRRLSDMDPSIHVTGTVADVRPYLWRTAVCVVPLRIGGGSRIKILEALSVCRPVVATRIAAEGLRGIEPWVTIEDEPCAFAERVSEMIGASWCANPAMQEGREYVTEHYSWVASAEAMDRVWADIAASS